MVLDWFHLHRILVWCITGDTAMKTIEQMRKTHWDGLKTLWPRTSVACEVRFNWEGFHINRKALMVAQDEARDAVETGEQKYWNRANYFLTAAYMGDGRNDNYWSQF